MAIFWGSVGFSQPGAWRGVAAIFATLTAYLILAVLPALIVAWIVVSISKRHISATAQ